MRIAPSPSRRRGSAAGRRVARDVVKRARLRRLGALELGVRRDERLVDLAAIERVVAVQLRRVLLREEAAEDAQPFPDERLGEPIARVPFLLPDPAWLQLRR